MKLIFVYNADSGALHMLWDWAHKIVSPATYPCSLCAVTYDNTGMVNEWKRFWKTLPYEVVFLHRDEFRSQFGHDKEPLPAVFLQVDRGSIDVWLTAGQMNGCHSLQDLMALVTERDTATRGPR